MSQITPRVVAQHRTAHNGGPGASADRFVLPFRTVTIADVPTVGGKNASLGEMIRELAPLGVRVSDGFAVTAEAFRWHLRQAGIEEWVYGQLDDLDVADTRALALAAARIREKIAAAPLPTVVREQVMAAYAECRRRGGRPGRCSGRRRRRS